MNWYKQAKFSNPITEIRERWKRVLGLGKYKPKNFSKKKKKKNRDCEPMHSLDIHCDGVDDGY